MKNCHPSIRSVLLPIYPLDNSLLRISRYGPAREISHAKPGLRDRQVLIGRALVPDDRLDRIARKPEPSVIKDAKIVLGGGDTIDRPSRNQAAART